MVIIHTNIYQRYIYVLFKCIYDYDISDAYISMQIKHYMVCLTNLHVAITQECLMYINVPYMHIYDLAMSVYTVTTKNLDNNQP